MELLREKLKPVGSLDKKAMEKMQVHLANLTKPKGSLGVLEEIAVKLAGITGSLRPDLGRKVVTTMAGDHGVVLEGVSAASQEVTPQMILNFINGGAAVNVLARQAGAEVVCVDVGVASILSVSCLINRKVRPATGNIRKGPAMSRDEARQAILVGAEVASAEIKKGAGIIATGDMGIGNTTPSTAILAAITAVPVEKVTGRGTGLNDAQWKNKIEVIEEALELNCPDPEDGLDVLAKVGGLEIGAIAGCILEAAAERVPVVIDGFISGAGALIAAKIEPRVVDFIIASHVSEEPGHKHMLEWLKIEPMLHMKMRLGEGTGAALGFHLVEASCRIVSEMATFEGAGVSRN